MNGTKRKVFCSAKCRVYWNRENNCGKYRVKLGEAPDMQVQVVPPITLAEIIHPGLENAVEHKVIVSERVQQKNEKERPARQEGDLKEGSIAFFMKYGVYSYNEIGE